MTGVLRLSDLTSGTVMEQHIAAEDAYGGKAAILQVLKISLSALCMYSFRRGGIPDRWAVCTFTTASIQDVINAADIASEEAAPGTNIPDSPDVKAPQAPGNDLGEHDNTISQAQHDSGAFYWQPGPYYAPPVYASGWYYQDVQGHTQGPFTKQQLQIWRQHLPMDLMVWFIDQNGGSSHSLELAKVLGDGRLLESWRKTQQTEVRAGTYKT